jgi:hypothetical protein
MRVPLPVPPSGEALQPPVRVASARRITMSVRKSITLLTLLLSASAPPFVAADVRGGLVARAALPPTICDLSNVRAGVADAKAMVDKGDLAAARIASRILINSGTVPWPARLRRPSRIGG